MGFLVILIQSFTQVPFQIVWWKYVIGFAIVEIIVSGFDVVNTLIKVVLFAVLSFMLWRFENSIWKWLLVMGGAFFLFGW